MSWDHVVAPAFAGALETAFAPAFEGGSQTRHPQRHSRRQARRQSRSRIPLKCQAPAVPRSGDCKGDCAPGLRPDPAPPTTWVAGSGLIQVVRRKRGGEEGAAGASFLGSKRRERKGKEEVRESIRSRSDGEVQVLVTGEKRKRVPVRCGLPRAGSLVERKTLVGAEEHQHQQRCVVRRAKRKSFEEGREVKRRGCDGKG